MGYRTTKYKIKAESNKASNSYTDFFYHFFRNILLVSIPLVIIFAIALSIPHSSATVSGASADNLTLSLPTSCTLSSVVNSAHNATLISGTYTSDIGKTTITTLCNDGNGYAIYANGLSNGTVGNNALISSVSNNHNIATGIYEQGDTTSSWAMKLGNVSGDTSPTPPVIEQGYNNTYGLVPSTWTKVAGRQSGTTDMITGSTFTTTYAVYTAPTQHAGTYTGQVAYVLIHGSGDSPAPIYFMQDVANWKDSLQLEESVQAIDTRDAKTYWVTKLKDGNIWMTQNLDLDLDPAKPLTSNNTDLTDHSLTGAYVTGYEHDANTGITTWTPARKTINFAGNNNAYVTGWSNNNTVPYSTNKTDDPETGHASLGNYYNWTAAIASNNSSSLTNGVAGNSICPKGWKLPDDMNKDFGNLLTIYNIIPNNGSSEYMSNGFNLMVSFPLYFIQSGWIGGSKSQLLQFGIDGYYWSNTSNNNNAYLMDFSPSSVHPNNQYTRNDGFSIRCLAR